jgi:cellulose synthase/poly-beta-1,6-N-acetylglucosamine synthase-like glycosyltransferase
MRITELVFFSSIVLCGYVYIGYPLLLAVLSTVARRPVRQDESTPSISVIIAAHNEERVIADKLDNTLTLDYPSERREIIVVSDGSTDATEPIVRRYASRGVGLLALPRFGKLVALNQACAEARGEILVFTDANALLERTALRKLIRNFCDPDVGGVCGNKQYRRARAGDSAGHGEDLYWTYDKRLKQWESELGSTVAADGGIYAIRRRLFVPIAEAAQADDFAISARVVTQGYRLVFEPNAIAYEDPPASSEREFWRKVRVTNHSLRGILDLPEALNLHRHGFYAIELLSHKVLRHMIPWFLLIALASNIALALTQRGYQLLLLGQLLFYGAAVVGYRLRHSPWGRIKLFYGPLYFCLANTAALVGWCSLLSNRHIVTWQPHRVA